MGVKEKVFMRTGIVNIQKYRLHVLSNTDQHKTKTFRYTAFPQL